MESQDTVDVETAGDRQRKTPQEKARERSPVCKSLGLSVASTRLNLILS